MYTKHINNSEIKKMKIEIPASIIDLIDEFKKIEKESEKAMKEEDYRKKIERDERKKNICLKITYFVKISIEQK